MPGMVHIENLDVTLGEFRLRDIDLDIAGREYFVVLGPTGAGKTVLIECIAGLIDPDRGRILLDGRDVTGLPPERRRVGYLPQDYALFPHLTVRENLGFGLMIQKRAGEIPVKIERYAALLGIGHLLDRLPFKLSGGEKQRVALGRALAIDPNLMLLDEPLAALDVATRERIGDELRQIHDRTGITTLHICHNFDETIRLADRVALVHQGRLVQIGTPEQIMRQPRNLFAAEFVRVENVFAGLAAPAAAGTRVRVGTCTLATDLSAEGKVFATVRPDDVDLEPGAAADGDNVFAVRVERLEERGDGYALHMRGELPITAFVSRSAQRRHRYGPGAAVRAHVPPGAVHVFPAVGEDGASWREPGTSGNEAVSKTQPQPKEMNP